MSRANVVRGVTLAVTLGLAMAGAFKYFFPAAAIPDWEIFLIVMGLVCLFGLTIASNMEVLSEKDYYSIPYSRDAGGSHRCIFCGHRGIWKSTVYQTNTVVSKCSKCQELLFTS